MKTASAALSSGCFASSFRTVARWSAGQDRGAAATDVMQAKQLALVQRDLSGKLQEVGVGQGHQEVGVVELRLVHKG